ncbi:hypothetical protein B0A49_06577 [Cryomyces minteri]|uniref:Uncharacterized protein n=1 Tax=Cryomyces minteri TaxID=331657 RepID=A0A4V6WL56_9PEZI|nr:hypothetical protein B0A49_06577 [Cryomyces minteri]
MPSGSSFSSSVFSQSSASAAGASSASVQASISSAIASSVSAAVLAPQSTVYVEPSSTYVVTSIVSASAAAPTTQLVTSVVTQPATDGGVPQPPVTVVVTSVNQPATTAAPANTNAAATTSAAPSSTSSAPASLQNNDNGATTAASGGLSAGGKTAVAVVVPVVVVALLVLAGLFLWRRRKQRKNAEEARRKEVEEYGFNPNHDPTLPVVGVSRADSPEMAEDPSGYRGWGNTTNPSNRKLSTNLSGGIAGLSDSSSNPGGYHSPSSPTTRPGSDGHSGDPLVEHQRDTMHSDELGAIGVLGAAPIAGVNRSEMRRGPSNASSSYSAGQRSDVSEPPLPAIGIAHEYHPDLTYYQAGPYGDGTYGGGQQPVQQQPVIRDVSARRNTRIENPSIFPQQGNSGISQNF